MDRSRRGDARQSVAPVPPASRLALRKKNPRRSVPVWARVRSVPPRAIVIACGRALRRAWPAIAATCALAVLGGGLAYGYRHVTNSERFAIEEVQVNGASRLSADDVRAAMPVHVGDNIFSADTTAIAKALRQHPWI